MTTQIFPSISKFLNTFFLASMCFAAVLVQKPAIAQDTGADPMEEIVVTGIRRSLDFAADIKRESNAIVDAITAQDIGLFSDNNIGEALSRVPGILLEREAGEGYRISIRGLGPRFVRTTVNGRTALSASGGETGGGDDARGFTYNILPSEVISTARVSKTTQAWEVEGGIGGVVDLETTRPLDFRPQGDDLYLSGTLRGTYNDLSEDSTYRGTLFLNNRFSENFGVFFAATIDQADRIDNLAESQRLRTYEGDFEAGTLVNGVPLEEETELALSTFSGVRYQEQPIPRDRETFVAGLQWQNDNWDINFDWIAGFEDEVRDDKRYWYGYGDMIRRFDDKMTSLTVDFGDENLDISDPTLGTLVAFEFEGADDERRMQPLAAGLYRRVPRTSDVNVGGLNAVWSNNDDWTIEIDFGYADQDTERTLERLRTRLNTDWGDGTGIPRLADGVSGTYDITSGYPIARLYDSFGVEFDPLDITHQYVELLERRIFWEEASDTSFRLDFTKSGDLSDYNLGFFDEIRFGVAYNSMQFQRDVIGAEHPDHTVFDMNSIALAAADGILTDVNVPGFVHEFAVADIADPVFSDFLTTPVIVSYRDANGDIVNPEGLYQIEQDETFDVTERNTAFYVQGNFSGEGSVPYRGNIGFRHVETRQSNLGWIGEDTGLDFIPLDPDHPQVRTARDYGHFLPSANLALDLADEWVLRFAANKALTRPDPIDMSSRIEIDDLGDDDLEGSGGNPNLKSYTTTNFDTILEWYPEGGGSYAVGLFYKDLESFYASGSSPETIRIDGIDYEFDISRPINTEGGTITGVEFQFHTPLDFLPGFWQYFGINGSYTYVDAEMDAVVPDRGSPISLRGTSEKSGNLVLYFEREKFGARIAANYRSDYLFQEASDTDRFDEFTHGRTIIDMNLDYLLADNMKLRFTANNLTDERRTRYWDTPHQWYSDERDNGKSFVLEFRYASD
jgi:TonB-dependent receptor